MASLLFIFLFFFVRNTIYLANKIHSTLGEANPFRERLLVDVNNILRQIPEIIT